MVELFSEPDADVLSESSGAVYLCNACKSITVISIASIHSVVAMFPEMRIDQLDDIIVTGKFSLMRHPYLDVAEFTTDDSFEDEEDNVD